MKYYSIPLTLALTACGTPSSSPSDPTSQECKGNRIWSETQNECIEPEQDATLEDAIAPDAGYIQKYDGVLYGVLGSRNYVKKPRFVQYHFATGKLEDLLDSTGNIIDLPFDEGYLNNATLSYDGNNILFYHRDEVDKVYNLSVKSGELSYLFDAWVPDFAWSVEHADHYFVSTIGVVSDNGQPRKKTRIYEKSLDGSFSEWLTEQGCEDPEENCEIKINVASRPKFSTGADKDELVFTCRAKDSINYEICKTSPSSYHNPLLYASEGLHPSMDIKIPLVYLSNDNFHRIARFFCNTVDNKVNLCKLDLETDTLSVELGAATLPQAFTSAIFDHSYRMLLVNTRLLDISTGSELDSEIPTTFILNGEELNGRNGYDITWFAWEKK